MQKGLTAEYKTSFYFAISLSVICFFFFQFLMADDITWTNWGEDGGDFLACASILGIPHPTSYPFYTLLLKAFFLIFPFGNIGFRGNLLSSVFASSGIYFFYMITSRLLSFIPQVKKDRKGVIYGLPLLVCIILALSRIFLSQAIITEVYSLNALIFLMSIHFLLKWVFEKKTNYLIFVFYLLGLGFSHHGSIIFFIPLLLSVLIRFKKRLNARIAFFSIFIWLIGLTPYLYDPLRAIQNPHLSWGTPYCFSKFYWIITASQYRYRMFSRPFMESLRKFRSSYHIEQQIGYLGVFIFIWTAITLLSRFKKAGRIRSNFGIIVMGLSLSFLANLIYSFNYNIADINAYYIPGYIIACIFLCLGTGILIKIWQESSIFYPKSYLPLVITLVLLTAPLILNIRKCNSRTKQDAKEFTTEVFNAAKPNGVILSEYDGRTFGLWYKRYGPLKDKSQVFIIYKYLFIWDWYLEHLPKVASRLLYPPKSPIVDAYLCDLITLNIGRLPLYMVREDPVIKTNWDLVRLYDAKMPLYEIKEKARLPEVKYSAKEDTMFIDISTFANSCYSQDPFRIGDVSGKPNHFIGLDEGEYNYQGIPFKFMKAVTGKENKFNCISTCFLSRTSFKIPLVQKRSKHLAFALTGGAIANYKGAVLKLKVIYKDGMNDDFVLYSCKDIYEYGFKKYGAEAPPLEKIIWQNKKGAFITGCEIDLDNERIPEKLVIRNAGIANNAGVYPGVIIFAVTQY
ncbi:MAG: DUF2723 domain-containing protein [Candidatus Coatesbacteria bacterium]|nr:DUF2723 domain-containing protein [Candidatus Coatesbacteria bacterium]